MLYSNVSFKTFNPYKDHKLILASHMFQVAGSFGSVVLCLVGHKL